LKTFLNPKDYERLIKLIRTVAKYTLYPCAPELLEDVCHDVYAYFLTDKGKEILIKAQNITYLKNQIRFRVIDSLRLIKRPLKCATLDNELNSRSPQHTTYYDHIVDERINLEDDYIRKEERRIHAQFLLQTLVNTPKTRRSAFICHHWEALSSLCQSTDFDRIKLAKLINTTLTGTHLINMLDRYDEHTERAKKVLFTDESDQQNIDRLVRSYRRSSHRCMNDITVRANTHFDKIDSRSQVG
jgi:hypothetical protein